MQSTPSTGVGGQGSGVGSAVPIPRPATTTFAAGESEILATTLAATPDLRPLIPTLAPGPRPLTPARRRLAGHLAVARISNSPTVVSNVLAGAVLSGGLTD